MNPQELLNSKYAQEYERPVLVLDINKVVEKLNRFRSAFGNNVQVHYAVKANPHLDILRVLIDNGCSFEIASIDELYALFDAEKFNRGINKPKLDVSKILYSNPVRPIHYVEEAVRLGVRWFVVDNEKEIDKVMPIDPHLNLYIRLVVPNDGANFPLSGKFGVHPHRAFDLVEYCKQKGGHLRGVMFHVGSQCLDMWSWWRGIRTALEVFSYMKEEGFEPDFLDIGGGFPVQHSVQIPEIEDIAQTIREDILNWAPENVTFHAEPGRYLVSDSGHLLCQCISTSYRNGKKWIYLDAGVFHGLTEGTVGDFNYVYDTQHLARGMEECAIAGPTCDSLDIVTQKQLINAGVESGDLIVVRNTGAYTTTYGTFFNGFPPPVVKIES